MKRLIATIACMALVLGGFANRSWAQEAEEQPTTAPQETTTEVAAEEQATDEEIDAVAEESTSFHQALKRKFIEGGADFMSIIALLLVIGLAICLERIIYLNLSDTDSDRLLRDIEDHLNRKDAYGYQKETL